jgi:hypothetical protein
MVARNLDFLTGLGYRFSSHLPGATLNRVGFSTDVREIGGRQAFTHLLNSSISISAKSIDQLGY